MVVEQKVVDEEETEQDNERLEFLGDSVIGMLVAEILFLQKVEMNEGMMTKFRNYLVSESVLAEFSRKKGLQHFLLIQPHEDQIRFRDRILCNLTEAIIAAIYLDLGMDQVKNFVGSFFSDQINLIRSRSGSVLDYKSELQLVVQKLFKFCPKYEVLEEIEEDNNVIFRSEVYVGDLLLGQGVGRSKKKSEQESAKVAYKNIKGGQLLKEHRNKINEILLASSSFEN